MRIAILSSWYPSVANPLYGIFVQTQAKGLASQAEVDVLLLERSLFPKMSITESDNVTVYKKQCAYLPNRNETLLKLWAHQYYLLFKKLNKQNKYDIIHCHDHYGAYAGWYINQKMGVPYVVTIHNSSIQSMKLVDWKKSYLPKVLNRASNVLAVGHKLKSILEEHFTSQTVKVIPNIVDTNLFKSNHNDKSIDPFKFLFIGDLDENKGVMRLLSAFSQLSNPNASLHIIGNGPLKEQAESFVVENNLEHQVTIQGQQPNNSLPSIYNKNHVYVSISHQETFGITILEAMSCGLPVIYTKSGGPENIIAEHGCFETSKTDISMMATSMNDIINTYQNIDRTKIRQHVIDNYSSSSIISQLIEIYKSVIDG